MRYLLLHYFIQELCIVLLEAHGSNGIALGQTLPGRRKDTAVRSSRDVAMQQDCWAAQALASCSCLKITQRGARRWLLRNHGEPSHSSSIFSPSKSESTSPSFLSFSSSFCLLTLSLTPAARLGCSSTTCCISGMCQGRSLPSGTTRSEIAARTVLLQEQMLETHHHHTSRGTSSVLLPTSRPFLALLSAAPKGQEGM